MKVYKICHNTINNIITIKRQATPPKKQSRSPGLISTLISTALISEAHLFCLLLLTSHHTT